MSSSFATVPEPSLLPAAATVQPPAPAATVPAMAAAPAPKRFSKKQVEALEDAFNDNPNPTAADIESIAGAIKDEPTRVKAWFGRKRGSEKAKEAAAAVEAEAKAKRAREEEAAAEAKAAAKRLKIIETSSDAEFLRTELLKSLELVDQLEASNASLTEDVRSLQTALSAAHAANTARIADAADDAIRAAASVCRALKAQLVYRGGCTLRAEVANLSVEAWSLLSKGRGKSFYLDEADFASTFGSSRLYKPLRYGALLMPIWPLHVTYNSTGLLKVNGKFCMAK